MKIGNNILSITPDKKYNYIDLFSGAGGFSLGFQQAGFNCVGAIDNSKAAIETHKFNFKNCISICEDIEKVSPKLFSNYINNQDVNIIIGGPPCPTFSSIGQPKLQSLGNDVSKDKRNRLFINFLEYVNFFQPEFFIMENVPNFKTKYNGNIFKTTVDMIHDLNGNYEVHLPVNILNAVEYGVPQNRKRMFLIGHKKQFQFKYPLPTHDLIKKNEDQKNFFDNDFKLKENVTVREAISDLPNITDNWKTDKVKYSQNKNLSDYQKLMRKNNTNEVQNNRCRMTNERAKKLFLHMKQGSKYMDLEPDIRKILPFREDIFFDRLKRLDNNKPSWTVIAHIGVDGYMYIHPTENRTLSVREAARLQSFPDDFVFCGNMQETYTQIGNAVPVILSYKIATSVLESLQKVK